jgi:dTDP-glucose pyrophosphorylase
MTETALDIQARLLDAVRAIENSRRRIAVVVDSSGQLMGTLTDGDVRRCLLSGGTLETRVSEAMNPAPLTAPDGSPDSFLLDIMRRGNIMAVPLLDAQNRYVGLVHLTDLAPADELRTTANFEFAVIMAGGEGQRLRPITENVPKAMLDIGGMPLLERQLKRLEKAGIRRVYIATNYLSQVIEDYFGDGAGVGVEIRYLKEREKLGTGGALSLLPMRPTSPIVVMNGDILTTSSFGSLSEFHERHGAEITVAAVDYHIDIPFGVINNDGPYVKTIAEKPSQRLLCNAGIYVLSPGALDLVAPRPFNMTDLIAAALEANKQVAIFPVHEYWSDIGTPADLDKARSLFADAKEGASGEYAGSTSRPRTRRTLAETHE